MIFSNGTAFALHPDVVASHGRASNDLSGQPLDVGGIIDESIAS